MINLTRRQVTDVGYRTDCTVSIGVQNSRFGSRLTGKGLLESFKRAGDKQVLGVEPGWIQ